MSCIKGIARTLLMFWKSTHTAESTKATEIFLTSGQKLMRIGLMSHIPDQLVIRKIQAQMQCHRQFYNAEMGRQMTAMFADRLYYKRADL